MPKLLVLFCVVLGLLFSLSTSLVQAQETQTTYYFSGTFEKQLESGKVIKYYPLSGGTIAMRQDGQLSFLHQDHLSSTRLVTSDQGTVNSQIDYYPYGFTFQVTGKQTSDHLYTSQIKDHSTNLYFYNARQYNPTTAAFISADIAQGMNRYAYVKRNPTNRSDPSGKVDDPFNSGSWYQKKQYKPPLANPYAVSYTHLTLPTN